MRLVALALLTVVSLALPAAPAESSGARAALTEGLASLAAGDYGTAARRFEEAAAKAGGESLDPAIARHDLGCALLKAGRPAEAADAFAEALRSPDARLVAKAHYNRGIALTAAAETAEGAGRLEEAVGLLDRALDAYEGAMRIEPGDEDPKVNHELTARRKASLEEKLRERRGGAPPPPRERPEQRQRPTPPERTPPPGKELLPDEARTMLDAMRQQEMSQRARVRPPRGGSAPVEKPW